MFVDIKLGLCWESCPSLWQQRLVNLTNRTLTDAGDANVCGQDMAKLATLDQ